MCLSIKTALSVLAAILLTFGAFSQNSPGRLNTTQAHPRILLFENEEARLISSIKADTTWMMLHDAMLKECDRILNLEPVKRIQIGRRLLDKSREVLTWTGMGKNPISIMRTSWTDSNAIYVASKGGSASINHAHMDIGSFVMDALDVRWAMDFGMQDYESLESKCVKLWGRTQNSERWNVFRLNNFTHNTLGVDSQLQVVAGHAPIISTGNSLNNMFSVFDLKTVYDGQLTDAKRGISILDQNQVLVRDEYMTGTKETRIRWTMLTPALASITGNHEITLEKDGKKLKLLVDASQGQLKMKTWSTVGPNDYDAPNPGTTLVGFELTLAANSKASTSVYLLPGTTKKSKKMKKQPLST